MSNEQRDELALAIMEHPWLEDAEWPKGWCPKCDRKIDAGYNSPSHANHLADAILAAGYRRPRTITTVEELDALPAKSAILDKDGTPWVGDGDKVEPWASVCEDPFGGPIWKNSVDIALPATVLHEAVTA